MAKDKQSRKYLITINNPIEKGYNHGEIKEKLQILKGLIYFCISDEVGIKEQTPHTHCFAIYENPKRWSTMKNTFPHCHFDEVKGTNQQIRDYVFKTGRWKDTEKATTSIPDSQEEFGDLPPDARGSDIYLMKLYTMIKEGMSNFEIIESSADYLFDTDKIDRVRLLIKQEEYKNIWRGIECMYIFGVTGSGKSRYVMETYGYENVFRVTDYLHPFDTYKGEDVIMFEEFNSSIRFQDMLNYLDGYPLKLPCRYSDKIACFTKIYITTNTPLEKQYPNIKEDSLSTWLAFIRRIDKVIWYKSSSEVFHYNSTDEYFNRDKYNGYPYVDMDF